MSSSRDIVLAGGGYAHLHILRELARRPARESYVFISPEKRLPYTGMLPGMLAGEYRSEDIHIDAEGLCHRAGVHFIQDSITGYDRNTRRVSLQASGEIESHILSVNTGPKPDTGIPGVGDHAISLKPVSAFLPQWYGVLDAIRAATRPLHLCMIGGGAGSVETLIGIQQALRQDPAVNHEHVLVLVTASALMLPDRPLKISATATHRCSQLGIDVRTGTRVLGIRPGSIATDHGDIAADHVFSCTQATAPVWPQRCGLDCDESGFIRIGATLESLNTPGVFATGDVAAFLPPLPKAGVFSVRQGPVLHENLMRAFRGEQLQAYRPQTRYLSLLSLGERQAAGSYASLPFAGRWVWRWKRSIDTRFIASFRRVGG